MGVIFEKVAESLLLVLDRSLGGGGYCEEMAETELTNAFTRHIEAYFHAFRAITIGGNL